MFRLQPDRFTKSDWPVLALFLTAGACALEDGSTPTGNTAHVVANGEAQPTSPPSDPSAYPPNIVSPAPGTEVKSASPTLTVANASLTGTSSPTYTFQVANDRDFAEMVARQEGVPQGRNGRTSWQIGKTLEKGRYFWRALARSGSIRLTSTTADFRVPEIAEPEPTEPTAPTEPVTPTGPGTVILSDPLTNFSSVGQVSGGSFTSGGWAVQDKRNYIRYQIPTLRSGYVQWENRGLRPFNPSPDQFMLFGMWDPTRGDYRANPFRVHLQKLDQNHNSPYLRLRWIASGQQHDVGFNFQGWDSNRLYRWRIQWGPTADGNQVDVFLDGARVMGTQYGPSYGPERHLVELGIAERAESIVGVRYLNVEIGSR